ncbi:hypothetical protein M6B38_201140 [Iris pallida]|uniref:Uncharacterized protein n=1 Tax=Iris pallida TaxID=29817 RepID=A0AAX6E928_IRIPA|nr:hypothetical protein M6B38_201140 [Iris pallida]
MEKIALSLVGPIVSPIFSKLQNAALPYFGGDITEEELQHLQIPFFPRSKRGCWWRKRRKWKFCSHIC